jgi:hypothetical protein
MKLSRVGPFPWPLFPRSSIERRNDNTWHPLGSKCCRFAKCPDTTGCGTPVACIRGIDICWSCTQEPAMGSDKRGGQQSASAELGHVMRRHAGSVDRKQFTYWSPAHEGLPLGGLRPGEDDNSRSGPFFGAAEVGWSAHDKGLLAGWRAHDRDLLAPLEVAHRGRSWPENEPWLFASRPSISAGQGDSPPRRTWQGLSHSEGKGYLERQRYVETAREVRWQDPMQEIRRWARELDHYRHRGPTLAGRLKVPT